MVALTAAACDDPPEVPTIPSPTPIDEPVFTGTLILNGAATRSFSATSAGVVTAALISLDPSVQTDAVGLALGTWNGSACQVVLANDGVVPGGSVLGQAQGQAQLCVRIYDVGRLSGPVTFAVAVQHF
jgi:hypothetical protein